MIQKLKKSITSSRYIINIWSFFHYSFINKKGIYTWIKSNAKYMTWSMMDFWCWEKPYRSLFSVKEYIGVEYENTWHDNTKNDIDVYWDGKTLPFVDGRFDSILATEVFEHIFDLHDVLDECTRVLKPWWHILVTLPFVIHEHEVPYDYARYTQYGLVDIFTKHGYELVEVQQYWNYFSAIMQLWIWFVGKRTTTKYTYLTYLLRILIWAPTIIVCNTLALLWPRMQSGMYLNNIIVAKKKK